MCNRNRADLSYFGYGGRDSAWWTQIRWREENHAFNGSIGFVERAGPFRIAPLICAENTFPPIPSELIMPLGDFTVARDDLDIEGAVPVG